MSDTPIFDKIVDNKSTPIYNKLNEKQTVEAPIAQHAKSEIPWYNKLLNPIFRRWAYGVSAAAVTVGSIIAGSPEFAATALPLIMAIFYVDTNGEPQ